MQTARTITVTYEKRNAFDILDLINDAASSRRAKVYLNGERVFNDWGTPAHLHATGSISVNMHARSRKGGIRTDYYKPGATLTVEVA